MSSIAISVAYKCDKAGRKANQDNIWVCPDLSRPGDTVPTDSDKQYLLSAYGALLVVADGMGGMHSGEKASELVIETVKKQFSMIPSAVVRSDREIREFISKAVYLADCSVKEFSAANPESKGMGSTIVLAWLVNSALYVAWTGDSRAYCFNKMNGITRLSHDHSLVQVLADSGQITEEEMFHHPRGNVITHSIGDTEDQVYFDIARYPVHNGDTILLCSDGLCGIMRDGELEAVLGSANPSMATSLHQLWKAGETKGWTDNVSIALMHIAREQVAPLAHPEGWKQLYAPTPDNNEDVISSQNEDSADSNVDVINATPATTVAKAASSQTDKKKKILFLSFLLVLLAIILIICLKPSSNDKAPVVPGKENTEKTLKDKVKAPADTEDSDKKEALEEEISDIVENTTDAIMDAREDIQESDGGLKKLGTNLIDLGTKAETSATETINEEIDEAKVAHKNFKIPLFDNN